MTPETSAALRTVATVLIADDEPSMRLLVRTTIASDDYLVIEACDGDQAWAMINEYKPSVVLLDVQMPGRPGLEVLASIKGDPSLSATRVIMMTARALESDRTAGMSAGADLYVTKPFSPLELLTRMEEALSR